jgi:hypothetical protein
MRSSRTSDPAGCLPANSDPPGGTAKPSQRSQLLDPSNQHDRNTPVDICRARGALAGLCLSIGFLHPFQAELLKTKRPILVGQSMGSILIRDYLLRSTVEKRRCPALIKVRCSQRKMVLLPSPCRRLEPRSGWYRRLVGSALSGTLHHDGRRLVRAFRPNVRP